MRLIEWVRRRDSGFSAGRRALRTALVMPVAFGVGTWVDATVATYAAFGAFALLLFVDFSGTIVDRIRAQVALGVVGAVFIALGTATSQVTWVAVVVTAGVAFGVWFSGVVSSVLAGAATAMLLPYVLSSSLPGEDIAGRLTGWGIAVAISVVAVAVLWPAPVSDPLRGRVAGACAALADRLRAGSAAGLGLPGGSPEEVALAVERAERAVTALQRDFYGAPYRPTGLSTGARALVRLVDELSWLGEIVGRLTTPRGTAAACKAAFAAGVVLHESADLLDGGGDTNRFHGAVADLRAASWGNEREATGESRPDSLDPGFRAQEVSFAVAAVAANVELTVAADRRTLGRRVLGWQPSGIGSPLYAARERAAAHLEPHSVWLHNSVRVAVALALAVLVARVTGVQHSFWVALGAMSVLRSNALSTGQTALRGLAGTFAGIVVGGALVTVLGTQRTAFWLLLPLAVLFAGLAPAVVGFAAGQAGFTIAIFLLFNIIEPTGWRVGIVRIEDVAIGCAVSLAVGLLFWPRGAGRALDQAMAEAYEDSAAYLRDAVDFGVTRCDGTVPAADAPHSSSLRAAASARRLDDAFRTYLGERGAKPVPLTEVTRLVTGVAGLRLAADAVLDLWSGDPGTDTGERGAARRVLQDAGDAVAGWYDALAGALAGRAPVPAPLPGTETAVLLREAVDHELRATSAATAVRMVWTGGHLDAARRLQRTLVGPARHTRGRKLSNTIWRASRDAAQSASAVSQ
ncbi:FUSC family protein [Dactylosporangium sp. AC04546]|uniref:FUSC family protein n=1 Tax=Dactylosporangium sp. AC04546 TaxID=2862460 RepID=UPI001EE0671B|nr:FUSC family protein [Dactylosporangium sp. AC04546]WVK87568.1 FUSC family protein [Dactylosporangium sp. AC04546]